MKNNNIETKQEIEKISELKDKLEELKKRLKEISTAQSNYTALKSIKDYIATIQEYLIIINNQYSSHIEECSTHTTQINQINTKIEEISTQIKNMPSVEDIDFSEINSQISTLSNNLSSLQASFNNLTNNSSATISQICTDISTIQTELISLQEYILTHQQEFTEINTSLGNMQTNIENLTTTQNNLTSAQNNLTTNVNNINSRLTSVEQEVNAINGGIDLTELDEKVQALEVDLLKNMPFAFIKKNLNITPSNHDFSSFEYTYMVNDNFYVENKCKLNYSATTGTLKISVYYNKTRYTSFNINLTEHPNEYEFSIKLLPTKSIQYIKIMCTSDYNITYNNLEVSLYGKGVFLFNYYPDLEAHCFDNKIFITKREDALVKYGYYNSGDSIDLENLPNSISLQNDANCYKFILYCPYYESDTTTKTISNYTDALILEEGYESRKIIPLNNIETNSTTLIEKSLPNKAYQNFNFGISEKPTMFWNYDLGKCIYNTFIDSNGNKVMTNIETDGSGNFSYVFGVRNNFKVVGDAYSKQADMQMVALKDDGYFYFIPKQFPTYLVKLCAGISATAYYQLDGSINIYINTLKNTYKYNVSLINNAYEAIYISTYKDCDVIYEILNNQILKHTVSANKWEILVE